MIEQSPFRYFAAPMEEIAGLSPASRQCDLCGAEGHPCFDLSRAGCFVPSGIEAKHWGCIDCLRAGRFGFTHDTEAGLLLEDIFLASDEEAAPSRPFLIAPDGTISVGEAVPTPEVPALRDGSVEELRRTPGYLTWNDVPWLVHCRDFMSYQGTWTPADFASHAPDGDGHALFRSAVADAEAVRRFWPEPAHPPHPEAVAFHVFRCLHCDTLRVWCDFT